jgi:hypothetical protein
MKEMNEDLFFKEIINKSKLSIPTSNFDDNVLMEIEEYERLESEASGDIKFSWLFFLAGTFFGVILSIVLPKVKAPFFGISPENIVLIFYSIFSLFILFSLEALVKYTKKVIKGKAFKSFE